MSASAKRRRSILDLIVAGQTDVEALGAALDVSLSTIRRDLARLAQDGQLFRTYGGAALGTALPEQSLDQRRSVGQAQKRAIARHAASMVQAGETVILDAGTTTGALAAALRDVRDLRVVTNGLTAMEALADAPGVELIALGGVLRQISLGFVGPHAERAMRRISAATAFLGADGVVAGRGICEATDAQAALKELMIEQANDVVVLADASKLGRAASPAWTPLDRAWTLVTDAGATEEQLAPFRALPHVAVIVVPEEATASR